jgi:hypothetical protein
MRESWCAMARDGGVPEGSPVGGRDPATGARAAGAEIGRRRVNEAIDRGGGSEVPRVFVCECGRIGCNTTLRLGLDEYENVRTSFERFLVVPGHAVAHTDDVLERHATHHVVARRASACRRTREADERRPVE